MTFWNMNAVQRLYVLHQAIGQSISSSRVIGGKYPYDLPPLSWTDDPTILPSISYPDIVNYFSFFVFHQAHARVPFGSVALFTFSAATMADFRIDDVT